MFSIRSAIPYVNRVRLASFSHLSLIFLSSFSHPFFVSIRSLSRNLFFQFYKHFILLLDFFLQRAKIFFDSK